MRHPESACRRPAACRAFTLVEVMIGASIGSFILAGVLTSFLMLARSGARLYRYNGMVLDARRTLEEFAQDVRMASNLSYTATSVTLTVPDNYTASGNQVTYYYDASTSGATARSFYRRPRDSSSATSTYILARDVTSCTFSRYNRLGEPTTDSASTKRLEVRLTMSTTAGTTATATANTVSATYVLRNKSTN